MQATSEKGHRVEPVAGVRAADTAPRIVPEVCIDVLESLAAAEPVWRHLEQRGALQTPYQRYDWVHCWYEHVGLAAGISPFVIVVREKYGSPLLVWPLGRHRVGPLTVAEFLGGKHANYNLPVVRRDFARQLTKAQLEGVLAQVASLKTGVDLLTFFNQPKDWDGIKNPGLTLAHQQSVSCAYRGSLPPDFNELIRSRSWKRIRKKERALSKRGPVRAWRADDLEDTRRVLAAFFSQKAQRMKALGLANPFADPRVREFVEAASTNYDGGGPAVEVYALSAGDDIVATFGGSIVGERFCGMLNSTLPSNSSPGLVLLMHVVRMCSERGIRTFDLGIGEAAYKRLFCNEADLLFDSFVPLTTRGRFAAPIWVTIFSVKREMKRFSMLQDFRRILFGR